jgi:thioredoxin-like negative regulator of GroEL
LFFACGFAALVNLGLATTLVWSELFTPGMRNLLWLAVFVYWVTSAMFSARWHPHCPGDEHTGPTEQDFRKALDQYLQGNWFEAEQILVALLKHHPRDVDASLMLATLLRHNSRLPEARACLERLARIDGSEKWELEIQRERELLASAQTGAVEEQEPEATADLADGPARMLDAA